MVLNRPGLADVTIAIAAAAHGRPSDENNRLHAQIAELEALLNEAANARRTRLAMVDFRDDPFMAEPDKRAEALRRQRERFAAFLLIDRPEGVTGHAAGATTAFNDLYGACLLRFATAPRPPSAC
jgi:hypothetical protein